ncbi:MAG: SpoIIE family protein phosphatase [Desulfobacterales bacterium]|nr:MAG: SpoIIE family protein phosphatase [Desulfobacterales bacterium]
MLRFKSLQQRISIYLLLPVTAILFTMGFAGFIFARNHLLTQWGEATILKLQRAAHHIDMRLSRPKETLNIFNHSAGMPHAHHLQRILLSNLKKQEGVTQVNLTWRNEADQAAFLSDHHPNHDQMASHSDTKHQIMKFHRGSMIEVTTPRYDSSQKNETISLSSDLKNESDKTIGKIEVVLKFDYLIDIIRATGWWQKHRAFLIDDKGHILTSTLPEERKIFAENDNQLEKSTLYAMESMPFGTILSQGHPPDEISGYYKLQEAPWTLVIIAPGKEALTPIIHFRDYYFLTGAIFILVILIIIRFVTGRTVRSIKEVSNAADKIAKGHYELSLPVKTKDEVGELTQSFNTMVVQLEDRVRLKDSLNLAMEVQQNLLPKQNLDLEHLDIAGKSIYCDETGGDYYDYILSPEPDSGRVAVAVGDVSGHGIASALFMTTVRALLRSRAMQTGNLSKVISDVNRLLCEDTDETGNFMTLFFMMVDSAEKEIRWVRAGHEPAILYDALRDEFDELGGDGMALGVDGERAFQEYRRNGWGYGQVILVVTDGIWETMNPQGHMFGRHRMRQILRQNSHAPAEKILQAMIRELNEFRQNAAQEDDITLVVIKAKPENKK